MELLGLVEKPSKPTSKFENDDYDDTGLKTKRASNNILLIKEKVDKEIAEGNIKADIDDQE